MKPLEIVIHTIIRTIVSFLILMLVSLWLGKQINSSINHYNFAMSITIGSFIANMGFDTNLHFIPLVFSFITLTLIYFLFSLVSAKSRRLRVWLSGHPTVLIDNGKILDGNMKKIRYTLDDLNQQLREQGIFDIFEVKYAILEVSGKLSVLKEPAYQNVTKQDAHLSPAQHLQLPVELIMDGILVKKNTEPKYTNDWIEQELNARNVKLEEVQYAVVSSNGTLFIDLFHDGIKSPLNQD